MPNRQPTFPELQSVSQPDVFAIIKAQSFGWGSARTLGLLAAGIALLAAFVAIERRSADVLRVEEGSLYPALHRLELAGLLRSEWKTSETNRQAKYYLVTAAGRKQLQREHSKWTEFVSAVAQIMGPAAEGGNR